MSINNLTAQAYDSGVLLQWNAGAGTTSSTVDDLAEITIQYSTSGVPNVVPNTPPYVTRELQQPQLTDNVLYHPYLLNGTPYIYSVFVHYMDTGIWKGPFVIGPITPTASLGAPYLSGSISFTKLETNTILSSDKDSRTSVIAWLPINQQSRRVDLEDVLNELKPSHTRLTIDYESYYVAQTTSTQFLSGSYASGSYTIEEGTIKNKIPTIDSSFSGRRAIYGG